MSPAGKLFFVSFLHASGRGEAKLSVGEREAFRSWCWGVSGTILTFRSRVAKPYAGCPRLSGDAF